MKTRRINYSDAIMEGFDYLLTKYPECFVIGQGLWSPWYVGNTMTDLEKKFGKNRVIDSPVSENSTTGTALGAALTGMRPIVVHPRIDFMIFATDQIVNQAAKWQSMLGGGIKIPLTIRGIINRGGEQGAQHSQALHSWYAHIPGLRVVMPALPIDARDLLISSVLCNDPVIYIDDRWCYESEEEYVPIQERNLLNITPKLLFEGDDISLVGAGHTSLLLMDSFNDLKKNHGITADVIDLRVISPLNSALVVESVQKTGRIIIVDGGWKQFGLAGEILAIISENGISLQSSPQRITIKASPAPTSKVLEQNYYIGTDEIVEKTVKMINHIND